MRHTLIDALGKPLASGTLAVMLSWLPTANGAEIPADVGQRLVQGYISPAFEQFRQAAEATHRSLQTWCAEPDAAGADAVRADFERLATRWSRIEFIRFGPLIDAGRYERISFWPDPRGMTLRQVNGLLRSQKEIPDAAALAKHSVALQGLPALEYVLYDDDGLLAKQVKRATEAQQATNARACSYAISIAGNLVNVSTELADAWSARGDYARQFAESGASNPLYRNKEEVAGEAIKALSSGLRFARDAKVMPVLGSSISAAKPKRAPFWRSGLTAQTLAVSVDGMLNFYKAAGLRFESDEMWMDAGLQGELVQAQKTLSSMSGSAEEQLASEDGYRAWTLTTLLLKNAKSITDEHIASALGVRIGFNALDGD
ncbi:imelysin family protein [Parapusillimonas sp. SGNA-6]|nr:imelysin family protein [Parapusillimonas sp. SGNA-6]